MPPALAISAALQNCKRRLHHRPQGDCAAFDLRVDGIKIGGRGNLGHQDCIGCGSNGCFEIGPAPGRRQPIDPDRHLALAETLGLHGFADLAARNILGIGGHGILQVEDQGIGRQGAGLFECTRIGAGHVENRTAGTDGHDCPG